MQPLPDERELTDAKVNVHDNGPTEDDEMEILSALYAYDSKIGVFHAPKFEED